MTTFPVVAFVFLLWMIQIQALKKIERHYTWLSKNNSNNMPTDYELCKNVEELYSNVLQFHEAKELQRAALGNNPIYFVHIPLAEQNAFSLSKFTAMRNISLESYVMGERGKTDGGKTQKHISRLLQKKWLPYQEVSHEIKYSFSAWIHSLFPKYNVHNANFISIDAEPQRSSSTSKKNAISPERLKDQLVLQVTMGDMGELIAYSYECNRLLNLGADPESFVDHVALHNASAGYDIASRHYGSRRFIEVKASFTNDAPFYITINEYETLEQYGDEAYLYRVLIEDLASGKGRVSDIIQNPVQVIKTMGHIHPVLYRISGL